MKLSEGKGMRLMLNERPTEEMIAEWKEVHRIHRPHMQANRISGTELITWLCGKYPVTELHEQELLEMVTLSVMENAHYSEKIPEGAVPEPRVFRIENKGTGTALYEMQEEIWADCDRILVMMDEVTGEFFVEGSSRLWDELFAVRGLDVADLENFYLVAEYIKCANLSGK